MTIFDPFVLLLFIIALLALASSACLLRSWPLFILQLFLMIGMIYSSAIPGLIYILDIVQIVIAGWLILKIKHAIDYNYQLILEKTHHLEPKITKGRRSGVQKSFL